MILLRFCKYNLDCCVEWQDCKQRGQLELVEVVQAGVDGGLITVEVGQVVTFRTSFGNKADTIC